MTKIKYNQQLLFKPSNMKNQVQINPTQDNMKTAIIMTMLIIVDTKSAKPKIKTISFDFGLSGKVLKGITSKLVEKSSYGNYLTKDFVNLIFQPIVDELTLKVEASQLELCNPNTYKSSSRQKL